MKSIVFLISLAIFSANTIAIAQTDSESVTEKYFEKIKNNPKQLEYFLKEMPKGADLHNHSGGSSWAENMLRYEKNDRLCLNRQNYSLNDEPCTPENLLDNIPQHLHLYNAIIDAWSMRHFHPGKETAYKHFYATFDKFRPILLRHRGEIFSEIRERAADQNELYLELMTTPDNNESGKLGKKIGWDPHLQHMREKAFANGLNNIVNQISNQLTMDEAKANSLLLCGTPAAKPGCDVTVRYIYQVFREQPPEQLFTHLLAGFEAANNDSRIVGINMVLPESGKITMRDYHLQMQMVEFLHHLYPKVHISLHAGELTEKVVSLKELRFHIRDAVETASAERIGHGLDITHEDHYKQLMNEMAKKHILVEINLTSNEETLGVKGKNHPLPLYIQYGVPVALSTDDEGVLRTNLTEEYEKAVRTYHFSYSTLKKLARNSIEFSFLPENQKTELEKQLEKQFIVFEKKFT